MFEIGRLCVKIAGRDSRLKCLVIDHLEGNCVLVDGQTRRRKCNMAHLEPLDKILSIKKGASHEDVVHAMKKEGILITETKTKDKKEKPVKFKKAKEEKTSSKKKLPTKAKAIKAAKSEETKDDVPDKKPAKKVKAKKAEE